MRILAGCCVGLLVQTHMAAAQDPLPVFVFHPIARDTIHADFTGVMQPADLAEVRSPLTGKIMKVHVKPGDKVAAGALLVELDTTFAESRLKRAEEAVRQAEAEKKRARQTIAAAELLFQLDAARLPDMQEAEIAKFVEIAEKARAVCRDLAMKNGYWKSQAEFRTFRDTLDQTLALFKARKPGIDPLAQVQTMRQALRRLPEGPVPLDADCREARARMAEILDRIVLLCRARTPQGLAAFRAESALAETVLKAAQTDRGNARAELAQCQVKSPAAGQVLIVPVKPGDWAETEKRSATLLAIIARPDAVAVSFPVDLAAYLDYQEQVRAGKRKPVVDIPIALRHFADKEFAFPGKIDFVDNHVDPVKGVVAVHAVFADPRGMLMKSVLAGSEPHMQEILYRLVAPRFGRKLERNVHVRLTLDENQKVVLVPRQTILVNADGTWQVLVVEMKKVAIRTVHLGGEMDGMQVVTKGLQATDQVIFNTRRPEKKDQELSPDDFVADIGLMRRIPAGTVVEPLEMNLPTLKE